MSVLQEIAGRVPGLSILIDQLKSDQESAWHAGLLHGMLLGLHAANVITAWAYDQAKQEVEEITKIEWEPVQRSGGEK